MGMMTMRAVAVVAVIVAVLAVAAAATQEQQAAATTTTTTKPTNRQQVLQVMNKVNDYFINSKPKPSCGWTRATYYAGNMAHYLLGGNTTYFARALEWGEQYKWETCNYPHTLDEISAANDYCNSQTFAQLYQLTNNHTYISNSIKVMDVLVNRSKVDDYWWIDAFFMGLPTLAAMYNVTGDQAFADKMFLLYNDTCVNRTLWDPTESLFYRDQTYIGKRTPHGEKVFWGRGNGWAMGGLTRIVRWIAPTDPHRQEYVAKLRAMADRLVQLQAESGFWHASMLDPLETPGPETTGTALFTFGLAAGINTGYLDRHAYQSTALRAWEGMLDQAVHDSGLVGYCQPIGGGPGNATATDTSDFCVGQFLLAASEIARLVDSDA
ncbi:glycosyl hydrolase, family 88 [Salpingoeca rosetta]|uniref:Glycosyl hydrolase, family 88 n=1 Tax=Salpingoeca rosetta (strain ATCC 50818 / BSB-021) TaxID=946362 RepID=F2U2M0_SALR5|nr:glycosyl hydrolase, family 88 [Salpingoeca rosetta]EGD81375.1 glycosyl hydrolase, family 88 [Salpingoeca rosetta]|eukprot:XP_004996579.1 glycosyl hydrolase, family 88 [Salpingoeca rosetta]